MERGHLDRLTLATLRQIARTLDASLEIDARWRGGAVDRLLDERHAALTRVASDVLGRAGWDVKPEVTFAAFGERGSIDLLGLHPRTSSAVVIEAKTEIASWEETARRLDVKARLATGIVEERSGWRPTRIGRILLVLHTMTNRRRLATLGSLVTAAYPSDSREVRRWLRDPVGGRGDPRGGAPDLGRRSDARRAGGPREPATAFSGLWFLSVMPPGTVRGGRGGPQRIQRRRRTNEGAVVSVAEREATAADGDQDGTAGR